MTGEYQGAEQNGAAVGRSRGISEHCDSAAGRWS